MIESPLEKVVVPHQIESQAAIAAVKLLPPPDLLIHFSSVLLKHGLRRVLDIPKIQRSLLRAFASSLFHPVTLIIPGHSDRSCEGSRGAVSSASARSASAARMRRTSG